MTIITKNIFDIIKKELKKINGSKVDVGYFEGDLDAEGQPIAATAATSEFGSPENDVKQSASIRSTIAKNHSKIERTINASKDRILSGESTAAKELDALGQTVADDIKQATPELELQEAIRHEVK